MEVIGNKGVGEPILEDWMDNTYDYLSILLLVWNEETTVIQVSNAQTDITEEQTWRRCAVNGISKSWDLILLPGLPEAVRMSSINVHTIHQQILQNVQELESTFHSRSYKGIFVCLMTILQLKQEVRGSSFLRLNLQNVICIIEVGLLDLSHTCLVFVQCLSRICQNTIQFTFSISETAVIIRKIECLFGK